MGVKEILITHLDKLKDKIDNTIGSNKFWWNVGIGMCVIGGIICFFAMGFVTSAYSYTDYIVGSFILGFIGGLLLGGGIDKIISTGASNEFLKDVKRDIEELKNAILFGYEGTK